LSIGHARIDSTGAPFGDATCLCDLTAAGRIVPAGGIIGLLLLLSGP
jgi:hypothetical protein